MNIIYIGSLFPKERELEIRSNSIKWVNNASNNLQWAILEGLNYYYSSIEVITLPSIRTYPFFYKSFYIKKSLFSQRLNSNDICLGFINIPLIKHVSKELTLYNCLKKRINKDNLTHIIIYGIHSPYLKVVYKLKKNNYNIKIYLIAPDLPQFMSESKNFFYLLLKKIDYKLIDHYLKSIDGFVFLTDSMASGIDIRNKPWTRVEGIFNQKELNKTEKEKTKKIILYTGTLDVRYGILNLLNAFSMIKENDYELWICGEGNCKKEIQSKALIDNRIKYYGIVPYVEILSLQKKATVLVNPRTSDGEYTKFSFPSKTMEYLASGTPCIMHKLPGIPNEYFEYVYLSEKEDAEGLKDTIINVLNKTQNELDEFGEKAAEFILQNKNPIAQVKKIYDMINTL